MGTDSRLRHRSAERRRTPTAEQSRLCGRCRCTCARTLPAEAGELTYYDTQPGHEAKTGLAAT